MSGYEAWLAEQARFFGITIEESRERAVKVRSQSGNPSDPICVGCAKRPAELEEYLEQGPFGEDEDFESVEEYVMHEEGTYNEANGHFLCTDCYIKNGQPSSPSGWKAP